MKTGSIVFRQARAATLALALLLSGEGLALAQAEPVSAASARNDLSVIDPRAEAVRSDLAPKIEALIADQAMPSITIVLFGPEEVLWAESFGYANLETRTPATLDTVYNTGSTFKFVVVSAIMQLAEQGRLSLDTPVNDYLTQKIDDFAEEGQPLTLRAMLAHRSGLPASRPVPETDIWSRSLPASDAELLAGLKAVEKPGTRYDYCNICFPVYAEVIRTVTGHSLEDYLRENILLPAGVRYTEPYYPSAAASAAMAFPYSHVGRQPWPIGYKFLQAPYSGDAYMRPLDMVRLLQPFLAGGAAGDFRVLKPDTVQAMLLPVYPDDNFSLGFFSEDERGTRVLSWDGGIYGGSTVYQLEPGNGIGVYIASNSDQTTDLLHKLARRTRELFRAGKSDTEIAPDPLAGSDPVRLSVSARAALAGKYAIAEGGPLIAIRPMGEQLSLTNPAGKRLELVMTSPDRGILVASGETITFARDGAGAVRSLRLEGDGYAFEAQRLSLSTEELPQ